MATHVTARKQVISTFWYKQSRYFFTAVHIKLIGDGVNLNESRVLPVGWRLALDALAYGELAVWDPINKKELGQLDI